MLFSMNSFSQSISQNQLIKRECDFVIITSDSMTTSTLRSTNEVFEEVTCYSSNSASPAIMFWFHIDSIECVQQKLNKQKVYLTQ